MPQYHINYDNIARQTLDKLGKKIVLAAPLGIGKPIGVLNAFYSLALADPTIDLTIITALTLSRPVYQNTLEERFVDPFLDRILGTYEDPLYERARVLQTLPKNIKVIEFFLSPGKYIHNNLVQRDYINSSYTNVVRDCLAFPINVLATQLAAKQDDKKILSLSCNSDLFMDMVAGLQTKMGNKNLSILAEINMQLPFMYGDAVINDDVFTDVVDTQRYPSLFAMPSYEITPQDHMIGLYTSMLVKDDGCIQLGIGKMSNAVAEALIIRQENNAAYQDILKKLSAHEKFATEIANIGDTGIFEKGLYASTEMLSDGYLHLLAKNIIKKKVYDDIELQKIANKNPKALELTDAPGILIHAGFFIGTNDFYQRLRDMPEDILRCINMTTISRTNNLLLHPELLKLQRQRARFINSAMMVTLGGVLISDGLKDLQEVSGVGGQFDFVDMASKLDDSRSIVTCTATRKSKKGLESNVIWNYTNFTIPRYLRDVVITEYGIADCRSKTDEEVIKAVLNIADSRFQPALLKAAKSSGKLSANYEIPQIFTQNFPEQVSAIVNELKAKGFCNSFPFGTEMTKEEIVLQRILLKLKYSTKFQLLTLVFKSLFTSYDESYQPYLLRMQLLHPKNFSDLIYRKLFCYLLKNNAHKIPMSSKSV